MNCWWEPGYWTGWGWINLLLWILLLGAIGFIVYRLARNGVQPASGYPMSGNRYSSVVQRTCPNCGAPVEEAYLRCPECHHKLKTNCPSCGKIVKTKWDICPYCEADLKSNNS